ncbi:MAG: D-glycerate dehydrogenase [Bacillota bacterium]|nr:D-glycerate dehydrogenase [Bacillota bacterium]
MQRPKVLVTQAIPEEGLAILRQEAEVQVNEKEGPLSREELLAALCDKDGVLAMLADILDREAMDAAPHLRVISNYAVGINNIDVPEATRRGIVVTNTPGVLTEATADLAWALLMAVARRIVEADAYVRAGKFTGWAPKLLLGGEVNGKVLGIVGLGRIGEAVARRARGFNMRVLYYQRTRRSPEEEARLGVEYRPLHDLLREADFVSLHVPLTPETRYLIGARELALMKPTAYLINTARGPVVDEAALVEALRARRIAGAGLDVFEHEPALTPGLADLENVVLAPHIGSATYETRAKMAVLAANDLLAALRGERPQHIVNPEVLGG